MQIILSDHMAEWSDNREPPYDAGLLDFILLITILVAFLETAAHTICGSLHPQGMIWASAFLWPSPTAPPSPFPKAPID